MQKIRLLLIEDDEDYRVLVKNLLSDSDLTFDIEEATSSTEGIRALIDGSFDCILTDYVIPGVSGLEVIKTLQKSGNRTPFIIFTAFGNEELKKELLEQGAFGYLSKGELTSKSLEQKISSAINH